MGNGKWEMAKCQGLPISHLPFSIQDAFFSILEPNELLPGRLALVQIRY
jgi:hypothetical protein